MIKRDEHDRLWWGPGQLTAGSTVDDPLLMAEVCNGFLSAAVAIGQRLDRDERRRRRRHATATQRTKRRPSTKKAKLESRERFLDQSAVFALVFTVRHGIELLLKAIILAGRSIGDHPMAMKKIKGHKLDELRRRAEAVYPDIPDEMRRFVQFLHELDPDSFAYRYSMDPMERRFTPSVVGTKIGGIYAVPSVCVTHLVDGARQALNAWVFVVDELTEYAAALHAL